MALNKNLHIVSFDVPYPADYGGVIDIFYKIQALSQEGIQIYLHVFEYGRQRNAILNDFCKEVYYYKRNTSVLNGFGLTPYVVKSRIQKQLIENLKRVEAPILFEGLHTTYAIKKKLFKDRKVLVRMHNVEHLYYKQLANTEKNMMKKFYYHVEALKLKRYERILHDCDQILSISEKETSYFTKTYGDKVRFLPAFHPNKKLKELSKKGFFALYHGNLNINDNLQAAHFFIDIFKTLPFPLVIAGLSNDKKLLTRVDQFKNISFIPIANDSELQELFYRAHVNVLFSNIDTGVKLKLINALFQSRYVLANDKMIDGSGLASLCISANNKKEVMNQVLKIIEQDYSEKEIMKRKEILSQYSNEKNAATIVSLL